MLEFDEKKHIISNIKFISSPNHDDRPSGIEIDSVIIHCISLPEGKYNNLNVENLFQNKLDYTQDDSFQDLKSLRVSSHLYIKRDGSIIQFVPFDKRAWHAGKSSYKTRESFNDFSIGIEIEGTVNSHFENNQYKALKDVISLLMTCYPNITRENILGHSDIAPDRKTDPGSFFDWQKIKEVSK
tara:strand:+ start:105 stop:656 length:552 start_codon:yes stop_codon:yes gene_type:complete